MTAADTIKDLRVAVKRCAVCGTGFGVDAAFCPFDGVALETGTWDPTTDPLTNAIVDQRYEIIAPLGEGGMGTVYKVRHVTLDRFFAMKVLRRDLAADGGLSARFMQEARATAAIHHPSVVAITDFGTLEDGAPYFVMELLVGETLATRLRARGLLPPREALVIARKIAEALGAAHAAKVVHRDLKPENVFLVGAATGKAPSDEVRIVDFGAAKVVGASKLTRPGVVFGTPYYMSPEQASGEPVDARADIYSLGVLLYEMVSGVLPFEADTYMGVLTKHMFATAPLPSERIPSGAKLGALDAVVMRALEKEPALRYPSMVQFSEALQRALDVLGTTASQPPARAAERPIAAGGPSTADRIQLSVSRRVIEEERRKRRTIVVGLVTAVATVALGVVALRMRDPGGRAPSGDTPARVANPDLASSVPATAAAVAASVVATSSSVPSEIGSVVPVVPVAPATSPSGLAVAIGAAASSSGVGGTAPASTVSSARPARPSSVSAPPQRPTAVGPPVTATIPASRPSATAPAPKSTDFADPWAAH